MKKALAFALASAMTLSLAACGAPASESASADTSVSSEATTSSEASAESASDTGFTKADGPIVYWSMWDVGSKEAAAIQKVIDTYCERSGNEVVVELKGRDISNIIGASIDAGENIDIYEDDYQRLSTTFADYALDLEDMAAAYGYDEMGNPALTDAVRGWAGSLKAIPFFPYTSGVVYNKGIFDEVGVSEPTTWDEFLDVCAKIKEAGYTPLTLDSAYTTLNLGYHLARYLGQDGVKNVVDNGLWAETPEVLKMAQDMEELVKLGYLSEYAPANYPEGENEIGYGETAMCVNASWLPDEITNNTGCDLEWGCFSYPAVEGGVDGTEGMMAGAQGYSINAKSKNAQAAFELVMFITTGEGDAQISQELGVIPSDVHTKEWPGKMQNFKESFDKSTKGYEWACGIENNEEATPVIAEWGNKLFAGEITAQEFVDGLEAATSN